MTRLAVKIECWWMMQSDEERAFYLINSLAQLFVLFVPPLILQEYGDIWWKINPALFNTLAIPVLFGWVGLFFLVRWIVSESIVAYYADVEDIELEIPPENKELGDS